MMDFSEVSRIATEVSTPVQERRKAQSVLRMLLDDPELNKSAAEALRKSLVLSEPGRPRRDKAPKAGKLGQTDGGFLRRAIRLAVENVESGRGGPFGAVIVRGGRVIAAGTNLVTAINDPSAHAEVMAIRAACRRENAIHLDGCVIYSSCEPCPMCLGAIHWARLDALYFAATRADAAAAGFDDSFIYDQVPLAPGARSIPARRMLARSGLEPLALWMAEANRAEY